MSKIGVIISNQKYGFRAMCKMISKQLLELQNNLKMIIKIIYKFKNYGF